MKPLWTAEEAAEATGGSAQGGNWSVGGIAIDTREMVAGDLFVALTGEHRDGHAFVADAMASGAGAALVSRFDAIPHGQPCLVVSDTLRGLEALGSSRREASGARIVGITGSAGKTTAKSAIATLLRRFGSTHASAKSHNNHWGVPLSLARMPQDTVFGVFELGMNHAGEIRRLVGQVRPHVALITTIASAHLGQFSSEEGIARAKAEILEGIEPGGVAVLPADNVWFGLLKDLAKRQTELRVESFGQTPDAGVRLVREHGDEDGSEVVANIAGRTVRYHLQMPGRHQVENSLGWLAVIHALGLDVEQAASAMEDVRPVEGRGVRRRLTLSSSATILLLDESYNANPASMRAALDVLARHHGRRVAVLGDMLELGEQSEALHVGLGPAIEAAGVATVYLCGSAMGALADHVPCKVDVHHAPSSADLLPLLRADLKDGDVVLVKGSLGSRMRVIVDGLAAAGTDGS